MVTNTTILTMPLLFEDLENGWLFRGEGSHEHRYLVFMCNIYLKWNIYAINKCKNNNYCMVIFKKLLITVNTVIFKKLLVTVNRVENSQYRVAVTMVHHLSAWGTFF